MINRRSVMAFFGLGVGAAVLPGKTDQLSKVASVVVDLPPHLQKLVGYYDENLGDMGRGHRLPLKQVVKIKRELDAFGFTPFLVPGRTGFDSQFIPMYASTGLPLAGVWFGFVRKHQGRNEIIAFETTQRDCEKFAVEFGYLLKEALRTA